MESIGVASYLQPLVDSSIYKGGRKGDSYAMECRVYNEDPAKCVCFVVSIVVPFCREKERFDTTTR